MVGILTSAPSASSFLTSPSLLKRLVLTYTSPTTPITGRPPGFGMGLSMKAALATFVVAPPGLASALTRHILVPRPGEQEPLLAVVLAEASRAVARRHEERG